MGFVVILQQLSRSKLRLLVLYLSCMKRECDSLIRWSESGVLLVSEYLIETVLSKCIDGCVLVVPLF